MDEVLDAEIIKESKFSLVLNNPFLINLETNKKIGIAISTTVVIGLIVSSTIWAGAGPGGFSNSEYEWWETPVNERHDMDLNMTGWRSQLPVEGLYSWSGPSEYFVR